RERAEEVPEVEILRRVVLGHVVAVQRERGGKPVVEPVGELRRGARVRGDFLEFIHVQSPQAFEFLTSPMIRRMSDRYMCGRTSRLSGAGLFLNTRPAMSNVEPWQGHRKPPGQSSGSEGCGPGLKRSEGEQPRCVQMPTTTRTSGLIERASLRA